MNNLHFKYGIRDPDEKRKRPRWESPAGRGIKPLHGALTRNGKDQVLTRQPRMKSTRDDVINNDDVDGGTGFDYCSSDPDPVVNCES